MLRLLLLALSLCGASAFAQAPDWRTVAPPLPLSAPVTPITAPVAIGGAAWGGWRKLCREQWERLDRAPRRDCLNVATVERDAPARATRLILAPEALRGDCFRSSSHRTVCGWKGEAHYYDVVVDGQVNANAAWFYPEPKSAAAEIKGRVAFWKGVKVSAG